MLWTPVRAAGWRVVARQPISAAHAQSCSAVRRAMGARLLVAPLAELMTRPRASPSKIDASHDSQAARATPLPHRAALWMPTASCPPLVLPF